MIEIQQNLALNVDVNELNKKGDKVIFECSVLFQIKEKHNKKLLVGSEKEMSKWNQTKKWRNLNITGNL